MNKLQNFGCDPQTGSFRSWANATHFLNLSFEMIRQYKLGKTVFFFKLQIQINSIFLDQFINSYQLS